MANIYLIRIGLSSKQSYFKMQKFVVVKKNNNVSSETSIMTTERSTQNLTKVEMNGYLKKKRNKVGGWRKMWFVLKNQLLLSYNSKEEYDKKLASFKDVLNLVPGTIVRPLAGYRFTIETTTDTIYTFRCDDNKSCTDWITALVESLSMQKQFAKESGLKIKPKLNTSFESIKQMRPKHTIRTSYSWNSICYQPSNKNLPTNKSPKIPIAQNTAQILKRTGVEVLNNASSKHKSGYEAENQYHLNKERVRNFRLHDERLLPQQSVEVNRINQMFIAQSQKQNQNRDQNSTIMNNIVFDLIATSSKKNDDK